MVKSETVVKAPGLKHIIKTKSSRLLLVLLWSTMFPYLLYGAGEHKMNDRGKIDHSQAVKLANEFVQKFYSNDPFLKDKSKPAKIKEETDRWVIFYEDKTPARLPSGLELIVEKKTGEVRRINQE